MPARLRGNVDAEAFRLARFTLEFGPSLNDLINQVIEKLTAVASQRTTFPTIIYPNAFHAVAELSIKHDPADRRLSRPTSSPACIPSNTRQYPGGPLAASDGKAAFEGP